KRAFQCFFIRIQSSAWIARPLRHDLSISWNRLLVPHCRRILGRQRKSSHANVVLVSLETRLDQAEGGYQENIDSTQHAGRKKDRVLSTLDKRSERAGIFPTREPPGQRSRRRSSGFR